ncbi:MAG: DUF1330 domain-containing protein [Myxococcota bacterium]
MSETTTLVVTAVPNPSEMESVQRYLRGVLPLLQGAGGKLVKRLKVGDVLHGKPSGMVLVMDFESKEPITGMFESDEYAELIPARDKGFAEMSILLTQQL